MPIYHQYTTEVEAISMKEEYEWQEINHRLLVDVMYKKAFYQVDLQMSLANSKLKNVLHQWVNEKSHENRL